jgi:hypothetical protein
MSTIINGTSSAITIPDYTVQNSAGLTAASPTITSGVLTFSNATTQSAAGLVVGSSSAITSGTAQASTSGTSIDFTGIPSWVKRITIILNGVSFATSSNVLVQLGTSGGVEITGYSSTASSGTSIGNSTIAFLNDTVSSISTAQSGLMVITTLGSNIWVASGNSGLGNATAVNVNAGVKTLSGTLDRVRITGNGAAFDAGSINILYE